MELSDLIFGAQITYEGGNLFVDTDVNVPRGGSYAIRWKFRFGGIREPSCYDLHAVGEWLEGVEKDVRVDPNKLNLELKQAGFKDDALSKILASILLKEGLNADNDAGLGIEQD